MNIEDFAEGSDSSDEDYVPDHKAMLPSEEESDGAVEDDLDESEVVDGKERRKRRKKSGGNRKKTKSDCIKEEHEECKPEQEKKDEQNKSTGNLWADFMKDTGFKTRAERQQETTPNSTPTETKPKLETTGTNPSEQNTAIEVKEKVVVTEVYHFAGEEVRVDKEVDRDSVEAKQLNQASPSVAFTNGKPKRQSGGGLGSVLQQLGKKNKISTLEKSKLDWEQYKKAENIQDELQAYSKSKDGYLERQDFLQRADLRQFEIEKGIRNTLRSNRTNNI